MLVPLLKETLRSSTGVPVCPEALVAFAKKQPIKVLPLKGLLLKENWPLEIMTDGEFVSAMRKADPDMIKALEKTRKKETF